MRAATLAATLALIGGASFLTPAPAAGETNLGKPGSCQEGDFWDFAAEKCASLRDIYHVVSSIPQAPSGQPPSAIKPPALGYRSPRNAGADGPRGGGRAPGGGSPGSRPPRQSQTMGPAKKDNPVWDLALPERKELFCLTLNFQVQHWKFKQKKYAGETIHIDAEPSPGYGARDIRASGQKYPRVVKDEVDVWRYVRMLENLWDERECWRHV